jgi:hypothetical protein
LVVVEDEGAEEEVDVDVDEDEKREEVVGREP